MQEPTIMDRVREMFVSFTVARWKMEAALLGAADAAMSRWLPPGKPWVSAGDLSAGGTPPGGTSPDASEQHPEEEADPVPDLEELIREARREGFQEGVAVSYLNERAWQVVEAAQSAVGNAPGPDPFTVRMMRLADAVRELERVAAEDAVTRELERFAAEDAVTRGQTNG